MQFLQVSRFLLQIQTFSAAKVVDKVSADFNKPSKATN